VVSAFRELTDVNGTLFFRDVYGFRLYKCDGTTATKIDVPVVFPSQLTNVDGTLFFEGGSKADQLDYELWKYDGTSLSKIDVVPGPEASRPLDLTPVGATLYFTALEGSGRELWKYDEGGLTKIDVNTTGSSDPEHLAAVGGGLYFEAYNGERRELWRYTKRGLSEINVNSLDVGSEPHNITDFGGAALLAAFDPSIGVELWRVTPEVSAGGPYRINEGSQLQLDASENSVPGPGDGLSFRWDVDGDGDFDEQVTGESPTLTWADLVALGIDDGPDTRTVTVEVSGEGQMGTGTSTLTIANVAPVITGWNLQPSPTVLGEDIRLTGVFADPGLADTHTCIVDWGDGTAPQPATVQQADGSGAFEATHTYAEPGGFNVTVTLVDDDGDSDATTGKAYVRGAAVHDGVLHVVGTDQRDVVRLNVLESNLTVWAGFLSPRFQLFPASAVGRMKVYVLGGGDLVVVEGNLEIPIVIDGGSGDDLLQGAGGGDTLLGRTGNDQLYGYQGDDRLYGGAGDDLLSGGDGMDRLRGHGGNDTLLGGAGRDYLYGSIGDDLLDGGDGGDRLFGQNGSDALLGGANNDLLAGGSGDDYLDGGENNDKLRGDQDNDLLIGGDGIDALYGGPGMDMLSGGAQDDRLFGGDGTDVLEAGSGNDLISGNSHQDVLIGGLGGDTLYGRNHDDILIGGATRYDANAQALLAILAEWTQPTPIDDRISNLQNGGGANGPYVLDRYSLASPGGTVYDDAEEDELRGGADGDWFLGFASDLVHDQGPHDR
jgi:Ca2+-binding RTX toxin-like protein